MTSISERDEQLRKLEPKVSKQTARALWLASLDPKLRKHVDPFIGALSDSLLDRNYREGKILLPPPEAGQVAGAIPEGQVWYDGPRGRLGIERNEVVKHVGIVGSSGSGKTVCGFRLARALLENDVPLVVFDVKRTWRSLAAYVPRSKIRVFTLSRPEISPFCMNFLIPPAGIPAERFDQVNITVADEVLYGGLGSHSILKAEVSRLRALYPMPGSEKDHFTMADVCREVQQISSELRMQKRMADWSATAQRIVAELASAPLGNIINVRRSLMERDLEKAKLVVFELDLFSHVQYSYLVISFLVREYLRRLGTERRDELQKAIIIEEAGRIFNQPYPQPMFETVVKEIRETGTGLIWLNQSASEVNHTAWANTNTLFVFKQISGQDINTVGSAMAFERPREKMYCARLGVGEAIVRLPDRYQFPFLIRTKDIKKIPVPDEKVREMALEHLEALGLPLEETERIPLLGEKKASVPVFQRARPAGPQAALERAEPAGAPVDESHGAQGIGPRGAGNQARSVSVREEQGAGPRAGWNAPGLASRPDRQREGTPARRTAGLPTGQAAETASLTFGRSGPMDDGPSANPTGSAVSKGAEPLDTWPASGPASQQASVRGVAGALSAQPDGKPGNPEDQEQRFGFSSKAEEYQACMAHLLARVQQAEEKPITYIYADLGLSKHKGTKVKKKLVEAGLVEEVRVVSPEGVPELRLVPTAQGGRWLEEHRHLLAKKLVRWQTKRFGGEKSKELSELAIQWATQVQGAKHLGSEVPDGFGGMWDNLFEGREGQFVVESITGESKTHEALHVQKALETGVPIFCLCLDEQIRRRILRYLDAQRIVVDGRAVSLMTADQARQQIEEAQRMAEWVAGDLSRPPVSGEPDLPLSGNQRGRHETLATSVSLVVVRRDTLLLYARRTANITETTTTTMT